MIKQPAVYLALGSNLGNRAANLGTAIKALSGFATVEETSFLYETKAQYLTHQPDYLNAVCRIRTPLAPQELLGAIEQTMDDMGRLRTVRYGPRLIDIDILFYDDVHIETADLVIPHPLLAERAFVLEPLCDIAPLLHHPVLNRSVRDLLADLKAHPLLRVMPIRDQLWTWDRKTYIMGILNITPDSFSGDGLWVPGQHAAQHAVAQAHRFVAEGADCLDVGGLSTRPGHTLIPVEEEMARVVPIIRALAQAVKVPLSVDTFRFEVAQAVLEAGAHMLNDVWGLRFDPQLAQLAAAKSVPLLVMHNRVQPEDPDYRGYVQRLPFGPANEYGELIQEIGHELHQSLGLAHSLGVPRWLLITDPGLGFGKTLAQQLELIRRLGELKRLGYPLLFGASRKSFIGKVLDDLPAAERGEGTLATGVLAIERGADILRVHDVRAMSRAARMTDAIVRKAYP